MPRISDPKFLRVLVSAARMMCFLCMAVRTFP